MHIYAFGSIVRGEISFGSDVDLLAIVEGHDVRFDPGMFSIYSYRRTSELWREGNPFAWHLALESQLLYSSTLDDFLKQLGKPAPYKKCLSDCEKFFALFREAWESLISGSNSVVFNLSTVFLSIRNFATCFSLGISDSPNFSRSSALSLGVDKIGLSDPTYRTLERSRILCTRGMGPNLTTGEVNSAIAELDRIGEWMNNLLGKVKNHE